jgi:ABC-type multidrug transport system fused ATPase/permease subunit
MIVMLRPLVRTRLQRASLVMQAKLTELGGIGQEQIAMTKAVRIFARHAWADARFAAAQADYLKQDARVGTLLAASRPLLELFSVAWFAIIVMLGLLVMEGPDDFRLGQLAVFLVIAFRLLEPVAQVSVFLAQYARSLPLVEEISDLYRDVEQMAPPDGHLSLALLSREIEFRAVTFRYSQADPEALSGLQLTLAVGQTTAIVGASGSGKSSLVHLLLRLYEPIDGNILLDGADLREIKLADWLRQVSVVSQDTFLFHASVFDNLRFARPNADDQAIIQACKRAQAHEFISAMPLGYDTLLRDAGTRLSGGQRQRISLARAFLSDRAVVILDEATSELDHITERAVKAELDEFCKRRTVLVIAHRLSTVIDAETIYVMDQGRVVETGNHAQLMALAGRYSRMVNAQHQTNLLVG